jgi:hypothetical protein
MRTTATHNEHDTTPERVLFMAFELSEKTWQLGFTTGPGHKPRERGVAARNQVRVLQEVAQAKKRFGLPESAPVVSCDDAGREGCWLHRGLRRRLLRVYAPHQFLRAQIAAVDAACRA